MTKNSKNGWVVQLDHTTGKERDDFWYLYCKERHLKCLESWQLKTYGGGQVPYVGKDESYLKINGEKQR